MIRAPPPRLGLVPGNSPSPILRLPTLSRRAPRAAVLAALPLALARRLVSSPLGSIGLLMDPAVTAAAAPAGANGEGGVYDEGAEFVDAVVGGEGGAAAGGRAAGGEEEEVARELPEELAKGVVCLECETSPETQAAGMGRTCRVYIVGTAHVSQQSCDQVKAVINYLKPQAVFLELCLSRVSILTPQNLQVPTIE